MLKINCHSCQCQDVSQYFIFRTSIGSYHLLNFHRSVNWLLRMKVFTLLSESYSEQQTPRCLFSWLPYCQKNFVEIFLDGSVISWFNQKSFLATWVLFVSSFTSGVSTTESCISASARYLLPPSVDVVQAYCLMNFFLTYSVLTDFHIWPDQRQAMTCSSSFAICDRVALLCQNSFQLLFLSQTS